MPKKRRLQIPKKATRIRRRRRRLTTPDASYPTIPNTPPAISPTRADSKGINQLVQLFTSAQWPKLWSGFLTIRSTVKTLNQSLQKIDKVLESAYRMMGIAGTLWGGKKGESGGSGGSVPNLLPGLPKIPPKVKVSKNNNTPPHAMENAEGMLPGLMHSHEDELNPIFESPPYFESPPGNHHESKDDEKDEWNGLPDPQLISNMLGSPMVQKWIAKILQNKNG